MDHHGNSNSGIEIIIGTTLAIWNYSFGWLNGIHWLHSIGPYIQAIIIAGIGAITSHFARKLLVKIGRKKHKQI